MSWLVSSIGTTIANSLKLDDDSPVGNHRSSNSDESESSSTSPSNQTTPRGVKEDFSELSQTLTRQFWGVASFLAPPPQISDPDQHSDDEDDLPEPSSGDTPRISGIRNDLSEIGGKFRTGISKLSGNIAVSEFTKIASNLLQIGAEEKLTVEEYAQRGVVGVTEEVVAFARDVSLHPETWLDFPLPDDYDDDDDDAQDFDLSDAQQEHALAVERLVPELAAIRSEICLGYMSEASFWKIYFVLVHPRLSKLDALVLSTPEIVKARAMLSQELRNRGKSIPYVPKSTTASTDATQLSHEEQLSFPVIDKCEAVPVEISPIEGASSMEVDLEMDKHPVMCTEIPVVDKSVIKEVSTKQTNTKEVLTKQANTEQILTKQTITDEVSVKQPNIEQVSTNLTNMEGVPTRQTNIEEVSTKPTNMEGIPTKQTNIEVPAKQASVPNPAASTSKSVELRDEDDADDWLEDENTEADSYNKGTSYPLGNDDEEDISFSDLEED